MVRGARQCGRARAASRDRWIGGVARRFPMTRSAASGFGGKVNEKTGEMSYGFAGNLRDALPDTSFIGFTGTPFEKTDANTRAVLTPSLPPLGRASPNASHCRSRTHPAGSTGGGPKARRQASPGQRPGSWVERNPALKGRDNWCRPFGAGSFSSGIPRALPWAGLFAHLWCSLPSSAQSV